MPSWIGGMVAEHGSLGAWLLAQGGLPRRSDRKGDGVSTAIQWTDETWNPVSGCTKVSAGCKHCYAETIANRRLPKGGFTDRPFTEVRCHPDRLDTPFQ